MSIRPILNPAEKNHVILHMQYLYLVQCVEIA